MIPLEPDFVTLHWTWLVTDTRRHEGIGCIDSGRDVLDRPLALIPFKRNPLPPGEDLLCGLPSASGSPIPAGQESVSASLQAKLGTQITELEQAPCSLAKIGITRPKLSDTSNPPPLRSTGLDLTPCLQDHCYCTVKLENATRLDQLLVIKRHERS